MRTLITVLVLAITSPAAAQPDHVLLARTAWSECGIDCADGEIAALDRVIEGTARRERITYRTAWALHSSRLAAGNVSRAWLADVNDDRDEPAGWPEWTWERAGDVMRRVRHAPWSAYRERCGVLMVVAGWVRSGFVNDDCDGEPFVWGSEEDVVNREPLSARTWTPVDCGETRNRFGRWL